MHFDLEIDNVGFGCLVSRGRCHSLSKQNDKYPSDSVASSVISNFWGWPACLLGPQWSAHIPLHHHDGRHCFSFKPWEASFSMVRTIGHTACSCNQTYNCQSWANVKVVLHGVGNSELDFFTHIVDKQCEIIKKRKGKKWPIGFF